MGKSTQATQRQQGIGAACRVVIQSARMAIEERGQDAAIELLHAEIADMVRLLIVGRVEDYNDRLDGFCEALGGHLYRGSLEAEN